MSEEHVKGLLELDKFLQQLPIKIERNIARGTCRAAAAVVLPAAKANIHNVSGELSKGLKISTRAKGGSVWASIKATGKHRGVAHLLEFGTKAHTITAKDRAGLSFGGLFFQSVHHPGAAPHPFMRTAFDGNVQQSIVVAAEYTKSRLTKEGLDVSDVKLEGDE